MKFILIVIPLFLFSGCIKHSTNPMVDTAIHVTENAYPSDNAVEEEIEEEIEGVTGLDIDITPGSPEKDQQESKALERHPIE